MTCILLHQRIDRLCASQLSGSLSISACHRSFNPSTTAFHNDDWGQGLIAAVTSQTGSDRYLPLTVVGSYQGNVECWPVTKYRKFILVYSVHRFNRPPAVHPNTSSTVMNGFPDSWPIALTHRLHRCSAFRAPTLFAPKTGTVDVPQPDQQSSGQLARCILRHISQWNSHATVVLRLRLTRMIGLDKDLHRSSHRYLGSQLFSSTVDMPCHCVNQSRGPRRIRYRQS